MPKLRSGSNVCNPETEHDASSETTETQTIANGGAQQMYRVICAALSEDRVKKLIRTPVECMHANEFDEPGADEQILRPLGMNNRIPVKRTPENLPPHIAILCQSRMIDRETMSHMFRQMNFRKYCAKKMQVKYGAEGHDPTVEELDAIEGELQYAEGIRNQLIECNLRLVPGVASRFFKHDGLITQEELVSEGCTVLMRAVEKFQYDRGNAFSTYATWAIMKHFFRWVPTERKKRSRCTVLNEDDLELFAELEEEMEMYDLMGSRQLAQKLVNEGVTDPRDRSIIRRKYRIGENAPPEVDVRADREIAQEQGVTKTRVGQLVRRSIHRMKVYASEQGMSWPEKP